MLSVLHPLVDDIYLITGGAGCTLFIENKKIHIYGVKHRPSSHAVFTRALNYIRTQLEISRKLVKLRTKVNLWFFFIGGESLVIPVLTAKLLRKNVVIASAGSGLKVAQAQKDPLARELALLQNVNYCLSDRIIIYSESLIEEHGLQKYKHKILIAHKHFLDFDKFRTKRGFNERGNLIGYIGRLSKAKGVLNFLDAIPRILEEKSDVEFVIVGDGQLQDKIEKYLDERNLKSKVKLLGWIPHDELPQYLNELKLLVLPSYTEGLPNIMLEAMTCGTPVLATCVGAIPDVIKDKETGFIMKNNSPECIARNVIRALNHSNLEKIARNARILVEKGFTYEKAVERYREILSNFLREDSYG